MSLAMEPRLPVGSDTDPPAPSRGASVVMMVLLLGLAAGVSIAPIGVSIAAVFAFAGPHNWFEARYFLSRLPRRLGPFAGFTALGVTGVLVLPSMFILLATATRHDVRLPGGLPGAVAVWNTLLLVWGAALAVWRQRIPPIRSWPWLIPALPILLALAWTRPFLFNLAVVYLHPLLALVFLDRELARARSVWHPVLRNSLVCLPLALIGMFLVCRGASPLQGQDMISMQIQQHVGAGLLPGLSPRVLVAWHAYLELLHYAVWVVAIPKLTVRERPWDLARVPLARRSDTFRRLILTTLAVGGLLVVGLWVGFLMDYGVTRDVYFTVAIFHVIAEVPMLLRVW